MIVDRGWAASLALAEELGLGAFVILHGIERTRRDGRGAQRSVSESGATGARSRATVGWGLEHQSSHGATADACAPTRCCACKRGRACPDPGKHPRVIKGLQEHGHLDARPADELLALISELRYRPTNLGIVPAPNVIVLDIDPRNGGPETLRSLEARYGALPPTLSVYTGGGGEHRWFTTDHATGSGSSVRRVASIGAGLDIKTAGGLLVAPPSTHITGRRYAWTNRRHPPATCPPWLDENTQTQQTDSGGAHRPLDSSSVAPGVIAREMAAASVGERAVTLFRLACWALRTDDDLDALTWAARGVGLPESKIRSQIACARQAVGR